MLISSDIDLRNRDEVTYSRLRSECVWLVKRNPTYRGEKDPSKHGPDWGLMRLIRTLHANPENRILVNFNMFYYTGAPPPNLGMRCCRPISIFFFSDSLQTIQARESCCIGCVCVDQWLLVTLFCAAWMYNSRTNAMGWLSVHIVLSKCNRASEINCWAA